MIESVIAPARTTLEQPHPRSLKRRQRHQPLERLRMQRREIRQRFRKNSGLATARTSTLTPASRNGTPKLRAPGASPPAAGYPPPEQPPPGHDSLTSWRPSSRNAGVSTPISSESLRLSTRP